VKHDCPGPWCHPYPAFGDDPSRWGLAEDEWADEWDCEDSNAYQDRAEGV
jgi:hypothetical protein